MNKLNWRITGIESNDNGMCQTARISLNSNCRSHSNAIEVRAESYEECVNRAVACRDALNKGEVK